jgi:hypothetical protein
MINSLIAYPKRLQIHFALILSLLLVSLAWGDDKLPNSAFTFGSNRNTPSNFHSYFGLGPGWGQESGTQYPMNSGFCFGATAGVEAYKAFGLALTYQHDAFAYSNSSVSSTIQQIMLELNAFSLLVLNGGLQVGDVIKFEPGTKEAALGMGAHLGLDISINSHLTAGVTGYLTFVMENNDHHSVINLIVPLKFWF